MSETNGLGGALTRGALADALATAHREARGDWLRLPAVLLALAFDRLRGGEASAHARYHRARQLHLAVSPAEGRLLYLMARAAGARRVVEFGMSMGLSTLYLAAAVRDNGGGVVVTTEIDEAKVARARAVFQRAGVEAFIDVRAGDALATLRRLEGPVDLVFLDGWEPQYLPVLQLVDPVVRRGATVLAHDVLQYRRLVQPYRDFVSNEANGYRSETLWAPFWSGLSYAVKQ